MFSGSTFKYKFKPDEAGTYWYHGHHGLDQSEGFFGAFIVLPRNEIESKPEQSGFVQLEHDNIVRTEAQYVVQIEEWFSKSIAETFHHIDPFTLKRYNNLNSPEVHTVHSAIIVNLFMLL